MSKKHHLTKHEFNVQQKHRQPIKRRRDMEDETTQNARVSHGRFRERNQANAIHHIRSIEDLEEDFLDADDEERDTNL